MPKIDLNDLLSKTPKIKYACAKQAVALSQTDPQALYSDFDMFVNLLEGDNNILKWTAIRVLGNLSAVDCDKKVDAILPALLANLSGKSMITAANTVASLAEIARHKPEYQDEILKSFLGVTNAKYYNKGKISPECRNIVIGNVIKALPKFDQLIYQRKKAISFLKRQTKNTRPSVRKLAEKTLGKYKYQWNSLLIS
jgi:hypothetical protein